MTDNPCLQIFLALVLTTGSAAARPQSQAGANLAAPTPQAGQDATPSKPPLPSRIDPKAQQILDRTLQALGGPAFLNFRTLTAQGRAFTLYGGKTEGFVYFDSRIQYPDKRRVSYGLTKKSQPIILINNGDQGWEIDRFGVVGQEAAELRGWNIANHYSLENLLRLRIHEPGVLIEASGADFVDNLAVSVLDIVDAKDTTVKLYVGKLDTLPVEISYRIWNPTTQDWDEYADTYADYHQFQGIATPMHITREVNGRRVAETFRNSATYNETYDPALFAAPGPRGAIE